MGHHCFIEQDSKSASLWIQAKILTSTRHTPSLLIIFIKRAPLCLRHPQPLSLLFWGRHVSPSILFWNKKLSFSPGPSHTLLENKMSRGIEDGGRELCNTNMWFCLPFTQETTYPIWLAPNLPSTTSHILYSTPSTTTKAHLTSDAWGVNNARDRGYKCGPPPTHEWACGAIDGSNNSCNVICTQPALNVIAHALRNTTETYLTSDMRGSVMWGGCEYCGFGVGPTTSKWYAIHSLKHNKGLTWP